MSSASPSRCGFVGNSLSEIVHNVDSGGRRTSMSVAFVSRSNSASDCIRPAAETRVVRRVC